MNTLSRLSIAIGLLAAAMSMASCNSSGCTENRSAVPLAAFYDSSTAKEITLDSLSISGVNAPCDSILSPAGSPVAQVYLPMRPTGESVRWCVAYKWKALDDPRLYDTVSIGYDSEPYFASEECGAYFRYRIRSLQTTTHLIDSVTVVDSLITNIDRIYLKIYFRVAQD